MNRWRTTAAVGLIGLPAVVTAATWAAWSDRLPARMATHWSGAGPADGHSATRVFATVLLTLGVVAGLAAVAVVTRRGGDGGLRYLLGVTGASAGGVAGIWLATATATLADPADPRLGWRLLWFVAGLGWGGVVVAVAGPASAPAAPPAPSVTPLDLGPTERAAYSTTLRAPLILAVTAAAAVLVGVLAVVGPGLLWPVLAVPLAAGLVFGQVRVTADRRGLRLVAGLIGVPFKTIPLAEMAGVEVAEIDPLRWGGWGYRVAPGRAALVLRRGPGLVLRLTDGNRFAVTLDDPGTPAALLAALQSRARG